MTDEMKQAQAMLNAVVNQRNRALDENVQLAVMVQQAQEKCAELTARIAELEKQGAPAA